MGDDLRVVNAARVSFDKESEWELTSTHEEEASSCNALAKRDIKLIEYLAKHNHFTPFTHCMITLRETVPIFVARQRFKHTVGFSYNEVSRRYVDDDPVFFVPDVWRSRPEGSVKQGSGSKGLTRVNETGYLNIIPFTHREGRNYSLHADYEIYLDIAERVYKHMIESGIAPEQARMVLPQSMMTSYYVTGSLAAWARAYKQRVDTHAQVEIQQLAHSWNTIIQPLFPVSWNALTQSDH